MQAWICDPILENRLEQKSTGGGGRGRASEKGFLFDKKGHQKVMSYLVFHILVLLHRIDSGCDAYLILLYLVHDQEEKLACIEN